MTKKGKEQPLHHSKRELVAASRALERMECSSDFDELEDEWKSFLHSIEKVWVKAERACQHVRNKFEPWQGRFVAERRKDPLLSYLRHARNSDQHTIQEMMETKLASRSMYVAGGSVYIDKLVIRGGEVTEYRGSKPLIVENLPNRIELLKVKDSGKWYNQPKTHLGHKLPWSAPIDVAKLGLEYYQNFINEVEEQFFKND